jgi:hypothetical protein
MIGGAGAGVMVRRLRRGAVGAVVAGVVSSWFQDRVRRVVRWGGDASLNEDFATLGKIRVDGGW